MLKAAAVVLVGLALAGCSRLGVPQVAIPGSGSKNMRATVENRVWIDTDPAAPRGTLRAFLSDGTLVMTSCTETYRLAPWRWVGGTTLVWEEDGKNVRADVVMAERKELALVIDPEGMNQSHHYAAAQSPVVCPDLR
ncbi:MAG: hypothetical protein U1E59_08115 [Amaricoccus sp.]